ncbi:GMC family oxidoreductase [Aspergillus clavatus NRRL 1]|uniref:GMC oxidoreductase, putative n=1 Tax=Aspergillus clavatus (strain ATCC 1007 / CBS 513.65 / DSM 816 / NCTC 3887 / NRRL 1 / QM 1276 / 107) TaxID=344612 RepID=A1C815_ASPCL|nr:GMC oxidoreductase, putative [Aspergillus clavatus NRRL 1]EAW14536.1 GMC oxidoreductase, putative [Aspergillus clavatus NRRL 1]
MVEGETVEDDAWPLSAESTDEEMDDLVRRRVADRTLFHAAGTASMGKVVDSELCIKGIEGLRVVDASVIPFPLATHLQMCVYAIGEQAADILQGHHTV